MTPECHYCESRSDLYPGTMEINRYAYRHGVEFREDVPIRVWVCSDPECVSEAEEEGVEWE